MAEEQGLFDFLRVPRRVSKPRETGLTLVDDRCLPTSFMEEFLELNADIIDYIKIIDHAGMFTRYKPGWMKKRLKMYDGYHIRSLPSGLSFEVAYSQGRAYEFFDKVRELGFSTVEISDDVIPGIPDKEREKLIAYARNAGLEVLTEIGRKFPDQPFDLARSVETIERDLAMGVRKVTIEKGEIAISKDAGSRLIHQIVERVGIKNVFLEPGPGGWPELHKWVLDDFGSDVNLGNIELDELLRVEAMRRGLDRLVEFSFLSGCDSRTSTQLY